MIINGLKPEILQHPNIPKALHGVNPREIMGDIWWDKARKEAYARYNNHCIACGVHASKARGKQWLEAHEFYIFDYERATVTVNSIEPLCHYCHNFIHSGRLKMIEGRKKSTEEIKDILEHGFQILSITENRYLRCFYGTYDYGIKLGCRMFDVVPSQRDLPMPLWEQWRLVFQGKEYPSKFKDIKEWEKYYKFNNKCYI